MNANVASAIATAESNNSTASCPTFITVASQL